MKMPMIQIHKALGTFLVWWTIAVVVLFVLGLVIDNSLVMAVAAMAFAMVPILAVAPNLSTIRPVRDRKSERKADKWDREHPKPSAEYKEAMRNLGR
jgi:cell division protein FtsW (lipid II flippase)